VEEKEIHDELASIRSLMERSSKFISLSGLSGVLAGVYALTGAALAYQIIYSGTLRVYTTRNMHTEQNSLYELIAIAFMVLILSLVSGVVLTMNKAKKKHQQIWSKTSQALLFNMATPLVAGGILILILLFRSYYGIVSPASLIFYGLALVGAGNFTFTMVKYLGLCEIVLGLIAACLPGYGLLFWAVGFGVLHIVYGTMMFLKYDR
jgi:predicted lysophospholipase L1 biosynthesis ABC-type transport system permease subunit